MKIVFFGTPDFAIPSLKVLLNSEHEILTVITAPDKKSGRGLKVRSSPISIFCKENSINCMYMSDFESKETYKQLKNLNADLYAVVAFKILPKKIINIPEYGSLNVHPSLLPKYRGASPMQYAILNGDKETGVSVFKLDEKVDSGSIIIQEKYKIDDHINYSILSDKLSSLGGELLLKAINDINGGKANYVAQNKMKNQNCKIVYAKKIKPDDCKINWKDSSLNIYNKIRAFSNSPGAFTHINNKKIKIFESVIHKECSITIKPGCGVSFKGVLLIGTADYPIMVNSMQIEGKKIISGKDFVNSSFSKTKQIIYFE